MRREFMLAFIIASAATGEEADNPFALLLPLPLAPLPLPLAEEEREDDEAKKGDEGVMAGQLRLALDPSSELTGN